MVIWVIGYLACLDACIYLHKSLVVLSLRGLPAITGNSADITAAGAAEKNNKKQEEEQQLTAIPEEAAVGEDDYQQQEEEQQ